MRLSGEADGGFALALVLMITTIIVLLGTAFLTLANTEETIARNQVAQTQALYIADAGVEKALHLLDKKPLDKSVTEWVAQHQGDLTNIAVGGGTANVSIQDKGSLIEITSEGRKGNARKTLIAEVAPPSYAYGLAGGSGTTFDTSADIVGNIAWKGDLEIKGDVVAQQVVVKGNLTISGNGKLGTESEGEEEGGNGDENEPGILHVSSDVKGSKSITGTWDYDVHGNIYEDSQGKKPGSIPGTPTDLGEVYVPDSPNVADNLASYRQAAQSGTYRYMDPDSGTYRDVGAVYISEGMPGAVDVLRSALSDRSMGLIYFDGNIEVDDQLSYSGVKVLVVNGAVSVKKGISPAGDGDEDEDDDEDEDEDRSALALLATKNVTFYPAGQKEEGKEEKEEGGKHQEYEVVVITDGALSIQGAMGIEGSVWVGSIYKGTNASLGIEYDKHMVELIRPLVREYSYRLVSWQEQ